MFFTSDTHFSHKRILDFASNTRPFKSVEEMNEVMVETWNKTVGKSDPVYHLGDFSFERDAEANKRLFQRLNGRKHLIVGNHDKSSMQIGWNSVQDYKRLNMGEETFILFHYPIMEWDKAHRGAIHLFGHVHGKPMPFDKDARALDVGWDNPASDFNLWHIDEVRRYMKNKKDIVHHTR